MFSDKDFRSIWYTSTAQGNYFLRAVQAWSLVRLAEDSNWLHERHVAWVQCNDSTLHTGILCSAVTSEQTLLNCMRSYIA